MRPHGGEHRQADNGSSCPGWTLYPTQCFCIRTIGPGCLFVGRFGSVLGVELTSIARCN